MGGMFNNIICFTFVMEKRNYVLHKESAEADWQSKYEQ